MRQKRLNLAFSMLKLLVAFDGPVTFSYLTKFAILTIDAWIGEWVADAVWATSGLAQKNHTSLHSEESSQCPRSFASRQTPREEGQQDPGMGGWGVGEC